jgi:hypothetical protein
MSANQTASLWLCRVLAVGATVFAAGYAVAGLWPAVVMFGSLALGLAMIVYAIGHPDMTQVGVAGAGAIGAALAIGGYLIGL